MLLSTNIFVMAWKWFSLCPKRKRNALSARDLEHLKRDQRRLLEVRLMATPDSLTEPLFAESLVPPRRIPVEPRNNAEDTLQKSRSNRGKIQTGSEAVVCV